MTLDPAALIEALIQAGTISAADRERATEALRAGETLLGALLRVSALRFSDLVALHFGPNGLLANAERPLSDRLGARLIAAKVLTQFQLKQALMTQVQQSQPLGRILLEGHGLSSAALEAALASQEPLKPRLPDNDQLGPLLMRWGILSPEQWRGVLAAGRNPAETLLAQHLCNREHLQRAHQYIQEKRALLLRRRHRLGEVLVSTGALDRETLTKAVACQVDQPFMLGELLVMQRYCSPEAVLEGLAEQQRRYEADAEAVLPPLTPVQPPEVPTPEPELEDEVPPLDRRRVIAVALAVSVIVGAAALYGMRYGKGDYAWLGLFKRPGEETRQAKRSAPGDVLGGTDRGSEDQGPASRYDDLSIPNAPDGRQESTAQMEADEGVRYDPFAQDGAPSTPNTMAPMTELPRENGQSEGAFGTLSGAQAPQAPGAYPMAGTNGAQKARYDMNGTSGANAPGQAPPPRGTATREGATTPMQQGPASQPASYPMRAAERDGAFPAPANVPPPPVEASAKKMSASAGEVDERTINRSGAIFHYRLGQAHFTQGRVAAARQEFLAALATDPDNPLPFYYLGRLEEGAGRKAEAVKAYSRYLARLPNGEFRDEVTARIQQLKN
ncbi:bacteriophage N4 adsorption protein B [compost metagenome]